MDARLFASFAHLVYNPLRSASPEVISALNLLS